MPSCSAQVEESMKLSHQRSLRDESVSGASRGDRSFVLAGEISSDSATDEMQYQIRRRVAGRPQPYQRSGEERETILRYLPATSYRNQGLSAPSSGSTGLKACA